MLGSIGHLNVVLIFKPNLLFIGSSKITDMTNDFFMLCCLCIGEWSGVRASCSLAATPQNFSNLLSFLKIAYSRSVFFKFAMAVFQRLRGNLGLELVVFLWRFVVMLRSLGMETGPEPLVHWLQVLSCDLLSFDVLSLLFIGCRSCRTWLKPLLSFGGGKYYLFTYHPSGPQTSRPG